MWFSQKCKIRGFGVVDFFVQYKVMYTCMLIRYIQREIWEEELLHLFKK
jgi:hypothetical protein